MPTRVFGLSRSLLVLIAALVIAAASILLQQRLPLTSLFPGPTMSSVRRLPPLVIPAAAQHTATVIFVHGLGDTGHGWSSAVENWRRRSRLNEVKFVLPHAPQIPITCVSAKQ